jgi:hypothetical protein
MTHIETQPRTSDKHMCATTHPSSWSSANKSTDFITYMFTLTNIIFSYLQQTPKQNNNKIQIQKISAYLPVPESKKQDQK